MRYFKNPANGYVEASKGPFSWLFALLWLEPYLLAKGNYRHFLIAFFLDLSIFSLFIIPLLTLSLLTPLLLTLSFLTPSPLPPPPSIPSPLAPLLLLLPLRVIYAFMISKVNAVHYLRQGWVEVANPMHQPPEPQSPEPPASQGQKQKVWQLRRSDSVPQPPASQDSQAPHVQQPPQGQQGQKPRHRAVQDVQNQLPPQAPQGQQAQRAKPETPSSSST